MPIKYPEGKKLVCHNEITGIHWKHKCLSAEFIIYEDGLVCCARCGKSYELNELKKQNKGGF